jgi:mono/diheme cytochrome c family protein
LDEDELLEAIEGGSGGCSVDWSIRQGGSLRVAEIKDLAVFILAWEDQGQEPKLPPLPPQPTPTPRSTPTPAADRPRPASTATPTPALDPAVQLAIDSSELSRGAWLYTQNCHRCHLAYEQGRQGKGLTESRIEKVIKRGKDGTSMTAFSVREGGDLTATEIRSIVAYVIAWETLDAAPALPDGLFIPPTPDPADLEMIELPIVPAVSGDPLNGARLYDQHCARCHGLRGEGAIGPQLAKVWPSLRADLTIKSTIANGVPGTLMPGWSQAEDGRLSEGDIDDLVELLLQWQPIEGGSGS